MKKTTLFNSNRSQVRLPKAVALPEDVKHMDLVAVGRIRIITPAGHKIIQTDSQRWKDHSGHQAERIVSDRVYRSGLTMHGWYRAARQRCRA